MNNQNMWNAPVLLLNSTFEPLNVVNAKRVLRLLSTDKAVSVETEGYEMHSANGVMLVPIVAKMCYFVKRPIQRVKFSKRHVLMRDNYTCQYCGDRNTVDRLTIDHIIPKVAGGQTIWTNVVAACKRCNAKKADRALKDSGMKLARPPKEPKFLPYLRMVKKNAATHVWDKYLFITDGNSPFLLRGDLPKMAMAKK